MKYLVKVEVYYLFIYNAYTFHVTLNANNIKKKVLALIIIYRVIL